MGPSRIYLFRQNNDLVAHQIIHGKLETMHLGPFWIDATDPSEIQITSVNLPMNLWDDFGELAVTWNPATDETSGVAGYS